MFDKDALMRILTEARTVDRDLQIFGAAKHKYQLNPVTTIEKVCEFERKYGLELPEAYVAFLTKIGNGGAGPYYGLYSLEELEQHNSDWLNQNTGVQPFIGDNLTADAWKAAMDECEDDERYDEIMQKLCAGMLIIGTQGCTYDNILMCKGSEKGKIVYLDWNLEGEYPPHLTGMSFEQWYIKFFEEIIAGNKVQGYGYYL